MTRSKAIDSMSELINPRLVFISNGYNSHCLSVVYVGFALALVCFVHLRRTFCDELQATKKQIIWIENSSRSESSVEKNRVTDNLVYTAGQGCEKRHGDAFWSARILTQVMDRKKQYWFYSRYPLVAEGDVIPLFGAVWEVGAIHLDVSRTTQSYDGMTDYKDRLQLARIVPTKIACSAVANCLCVPLGGYVERVALEGHRNGVGNFSTYYLEVTGIGPRNKDQVVARHISEPITAIVDVRTIDHSGNECEKGSHGQHKVVTVKVNDILNVPEIMCVDEAGNKTVLFPADRFMVLDIVAEDVKQKVIGWVTLQPLLENWPRPVAAKE